MSDDGTYGLVRRMADHLDLLGIPYAVGGSVATSLLGEPRSTIDVDIAVELDGPRGERLFDLVAAEFFVPIEFAREAIAERSSFNLLELSSALKVDLFVLGDGPLDRQQMVRRVLVELPGTGRTVWVTSATDMVLRKLAWFRAGGEVSDRQWRDIVAVLQVQRDDLDLEYLEEMATQTGVEDLLRAAQREARGGPIS